MRALGWLFGILVVVAAGVAVGIIVVNRLETGTFRMPTGDDLIRVKRMIIPDRGPPRAIYLHRDAIVIAPGNDDAARNTSSVVASVRTTNVELGGFAGKDKTWKQIVACVEDLFSPFDIAVTTTRPTSGNYMLVAVGGKPADLGVKNHHVGGLAPFSGGVISRAVVFAFSQALDNRVRATCETIGMEVAHAFGLDHAYECKDVMTYKSGCGNKRFLDKDVRCGEEKARDCKPSEAPTQNSFQTLMKVLGPRRPKT